VETGLKLGLVVFFFLHGAKEKTSADKKKKKKSLVGCDMEFSFAFLSS